MCEIQRFYIFPKNDWKRHQNSLVLWIMTKHFVCFFLARRNQYTNVGKLFLFLKLIHVDSHGLFVDSHGSHVDSHDSLARWLAGSLDRILYTLTQLTWPTAKATVVLQDGVTRAYPQSQTSKTVNFLNFSVHISESP